ncbi:TIGR04338 family metallohydrolase, partial [Rhodococcus qingshengii]|uniref:TIGR04338 family metallohydrolase n=1 Tax=Rhodococcus qingshengii TaxID=334542 RepID=UPI0018D3C9C0
RSAVYEAETLVRTMFDRADQRGLRSVEVMGSTITLPVERKFGSVESVQAYCDQLLGLNWVRETWTRATIPVSVRSRASHGPEFVDRYTSLVGEIIGPEAAFVLRAMFLAGGVRTD